MAKAQGSLEYMIIIAVVLAVSAVVVTYMTNAMAGQKTSVSISSCKQAAIDCKSSKMLSPNDPCIACNTACKDSSGIELFDGATYCCTAGRPDMIYPNSTGCGAGYTTTTCSDGTLKANCSINKPKYCDLNLKLVDDCVTCGCPENYTCNATSKSCYLACSDGTPYGYCSATQPKYCNPEGQLVDNCQTCGCPSGYSCDTVSGICRIPCSDGTLSGNCSATKPLYCDNGVLVNDCVKCGCEIGTCNSVTKLCGCSDGTALNACSATKPLYCNSLGQLVNNCTSCGCSSGTCNTTSNACYTSLVLVELFYDEFYNLNAWSGDISATLWHANLTSGYNNSNSAFKDAYGSHFIYHAQNTTNVTNINVSFWALNNLRDSGEQFKFEWYNGSAWIAALFPNNGIWTYYSYLLPASANNNSNFAIRFTCYDWHQTDPDQCQLDTLRITGLRPGCSDGTLLGQCSSTKPKYCTPEGQLVNKCQTCGCPPAGSEFPCCCDDLNRGTCQVTYSCNTDGSCTSDVISKNCSPCSSGCCIGNKCGSIC
jgi:hypothetical protein